MNKNTAPIKRHRSTGWHLFDPAIFVHALSTSIKSKFSIIWGAIGVVVVAIVMALPDILGITSSGLMLGMLIMCLALVLLIFVSVWDIVNMVQLYSADHTLGVMNLEIRKGRRISAIFFSRYLANKILLAGYLLLMYFIYLIIIENGSSALHSWNALMVWTMMPVDIACSCIFLFCFAFWRHRLAIGMSSFILTMTLLTPVLGQLGSLGLGDVHWTERVYSSSIEKYVASDTYLSQFYDSSKDDFATEMMNSYYQFGYSFESEDGYSSVDEITRTSVDKYVAKAVMANGIISTKDIGQNVSDVADSAKDATVNLITNESNPYLYRALTNNIDDSLKSHYTNSNGEIQDVFFYINDNYLYDIDGLKKFDTTTSGDYTPIYSNNKDDSKNASPILLKINDDYIDAHPISQTTKQEWVNSILLNTDNTKSRKKDALSQLQEVISWINDEWTADGYSKNEAEAFNQMIYDYVKDNLGVYSDTEYMWNEESNSSEEIIWHYNLKPFGYSSDASQTLAEQLGDWSKQDFANNVQTSPGLAIYNQAVQAILSFVQTQHKTDWDNSYGGAFVDIPTYKATVLALPWAMTGNEWYHPYTNISWYERSQESQRLIFGSEQNFIYQYSDYYFEGEELRIGDYDASYEFAKPSTDADSLTGIYFDDETSGEPKTVEIYSVTGYNIALVVIGLTFAGFSFLAFYRRVKY